MRKYLVILVSVLFISSSAKAQLVPDGSYQIVVPQVDFVNLSYYGPKYIEYIYPGTTITFYNPDFTVWKTININVPGYDQLSILSHVSDKLVDTDTLVELVVSLGATGQNNTHGFLINENSYVYYDFGVGNIDMVDVKWVNGAYKMLVRHLPGPGYRVVLPMEGYLPCETCVEDTTGVELKTPTVTPAGSSGLILSDPIPNPSNGKVSIGYSLPENTSNGDIVFYNTNGQEVKRIAVKSGSNNVEVDNRDLASGIYYYHLFGGGKRSAGNKMTVLH